MASKSDSLPNISPETARKLFDNGGVLVVLNLPIGSVFGIDMKVNTVGEKFRGIKMIPPGLHFIYYSAVSKEGIVSPRTGFFHFFKRQEILLRKWNKAEEELVEGAESTEELARVKDNLQSLDSYLGAYPYQTLKSWNRLTCNINEPLLMKLQPLCRNICSVTQLIPLSYPPEQEGPSTSSARKRPFQSLEEKYLPEMKQIPGTEIRFTKLPEAWYPDSSNAAEITKYSMDSTYALEQVLKSFERQDDILGELQMALVCFLIAHTYEAFEHWKQLVELLCKVDAGLGRFSPLLTDFLTLLHYQIKEIPTDFFVDITGDNNFLVHTLQVFFENVENGETSEAFRTLVRNFKKNLTKTFKWKFDVVPDDELPVVVDT